MPDPLTLFATAGNILQFVEVGVKLISKAYEYHSAADGALKDHHDLAQIASVLKNLNVNLEPKWKSNSNNVNDAERAVCFANSECLKVSQEFLTLLDKLQLHGTKSSWKAVQLAIKSLWKRDRIDGLERRVTHARANLTIAYLVYMQGANETQLQQMKSNTFGTRDEILRELQFATSDLRDDIAKLATDLGGLRIDGDSLQQGMTTFYTANEDRMETLVEKLQQLLHTYSDDRVKATARTIRSSLKFEQLEERHSLVSQATINTFGWIFRPQDPNQQMGHYFPAWLALGGNNVRRIFWISGKAASGKSTLMRYLSEKLGDMSFFLEQWHGPRTLLQAHCFFWNAGSYLQKSLHGLLRSVLYQLLNGMLNQIRDFVTPQRWADVFTEGKGSINWTNNELLDIIISLVTQNYDTACVFLLIDGLDEFEGTDEERQKVIDVLKHLTAFENVKICASSRPWNIFIDAFENCLTLKVEDYTRTDIRRYVVSRFEKSPHFANLVRHEGLDPNQLITHITNKANGVFLWVRLVVATLLAGMRDGDDVRTVMERLDQVPSDLDKLFQRMFETIEPAYLRESSVMFQIMLHGRDCKAGNKPTLLDFSYIDPSNANFTLKHDFRHPQDQNHIQITYTLHRAARKLNGYGMGLLSTNYCLSTTCDPSICAMQLDKHSLAIDFLHRTVSDFFASDENRRRLYQLTNGPFATRSFCCNAMLMGVNPQVTNNQCGKDNADLMATIDRLVKHATEESDETLICPEVLQHEIEVILQRTASKSGKPHGDSVSVEVFTSWEAYNNDLLTTAIQFGQADFVEEHLTRKVLLERRGRPFLDYALWYQASETQDYGPSIRIVRHILNLGADPNEQFKGESVWLSFMWLVQSKMRYRHLFKRYFEFVTSIIGFMVSHGADVGSYKLRRIIRQLETTSR